MTTMIPQVSKCAVCGSRHRFLALASTNQFGAPDLDFRPPEMARSTIDEWVQECPTCGYVAPNISDDPGKVTREYLQSAEYRGCDGLQFASELAARFYRFSKICLLNGALSDAYQGLIYAAWACDDDGDDKNAIYCREAAVDMYDRVIATSIRDVEKKDMLLQKADLLRRSGQFERLVEEYTGLHMASDFENRILEFHLHCAKRKDRNCYTLDDVEKFSGQPEEKSQ